MPQRKKGVAELFINALEDSSNDPKREYTCEVKEPLTDKEKIREFFNKRFKSIPYRDANG